GGFGLLIGFGAAGCHSYIADAAGDRVDSGYQAVSPAGLSFKVQLPKDWTSTGAVPGEVQFQSPQSPWTISLGEMPMPPVPAGKSPRDAAAEMLMSAMQPELPALVKREDMSGLFPARSMEI